jgi:hypothetical protein
MAADYDTDFRVSCFGTYGLAQRIYFESKEDADEFIRNNGSNYAKCVLEENVGWKAVGANSCQ